jgi:hypothetical protein
MISDLMSFNPQRWIYGLLGGMIGAAVACTIIIIFYFFSDYRKQMQYRNRILKRLDTADMMLRESMTMDALSIYNELLLNMPKLREPELFAHIKQSLGNCYYSIALTRNTPENLIKAIQSYEEALPYINYQKKPDDYISIQTLLGDSYMKLSESLKKEECLA